MAAKKKAAKKAAKAGGAKRTPAQGIGALAKELILAGKSNPEVLDALKKKFPDSKANVGTIGWYRNNLRSNGKKVKSSRSITAAQGKPAAAAKKAAPRKKVVKVPDPPAQHAEAPAAESAETLV